MRSRRFSGRTRSAPPPSKSLPGTSEMLLSRMRSTPAVTIGPMSRLRGALLALALVVVAVPGPAVPASQSVAAPTKVLAPSFVAIEASSGRVLAARGAAIRRPIASLTKVMTALTVIERGDLEGRIVVTPLATSVEPYKEGLVAGRAYTRETLLWSALLASSNDSATALAIDAGGSLPGFYALANAKARALGMTSTT